MIDRRAFTAGIVALPAVASAMAEARSPGMYGLISQFTTLPAHRHEFVRILAAATRGMPGCLGYVVALDATRDDAVWVTEIWQDADAHAASLKLPAVVEALAKGRPLVTGMGTRVTTTPVSVA